MADKEYYKKLEESEEYQDFVMEQLITRLGLSAPCYCSKKYQHEKGESICGFEIKYQKALSKTGNLYIEYAEKPSADKKEYWPSGIEREDNSWLIVTGDYETIYLFPKKYLKMLKNNKVAKHITTPTSKGYLLSKVDAEKYAALVIKVNKC